MKTSILAVATAAGLLCACASNPDKISAAYVSPLKYKDYDCDQIAMEMDYVGQRTNRIYQNLKKENKADKWQMGVGLLVFWPTLFALEGGDGPEATEYAQLKGEFEALRVTSVQKKCGSQDRTFKDTVAAAQEQTAANGQNAKTEQTGTVDGDPVDQSLNGFIGQYYLVISSDHGGRESISLDKGRLVPVGGDGVRWESSRTGNTVEFILAQDSQSSSYLFTYSLKDVIAREPLLSLDKIPLDYSSVDGYSGNKVTDDTQILLEIGIKREHGKVAGSIVGQKGGQLLFKHELNFSEDDSSETAGAMEETTPPPDAGEAAPTELAAKVASASAVAPQPAPSQTKPSPAKVTSEPLPPATSAGSPGTWIGKTDQGLDMTATVEMVDGVLTVTALKYDAKISGPMYSVMKQMMQPERVSIAVTDGEFEHRGSDFKISGVFRGDSLIGRLNLTDVHPRGLGSAQASVNFDLKNTTEPLAAKSSKPGVTTITGILVDESGAPVEAQVEVLFGERYALKIDEDGYVLNPSSVYTDKDGNFIIEVHRERLSEEDLADIRLVVSDSPLKSQDGAVFSLNIVRGDTNLDLGRITVKR